MLNGLRTVVYQVKSLAEAKEWYSRLLERAPYFDEPFYVGFDVGGYELGLHPTSGEGGAGDRGPGIGGDTAYWAVEDARAALTRATSLGAKLHQAAQDVGEGIVVGSVVDPFGNVLGVIENLHFAPPWVWARAGSVSDRRIVKEGVVPVPPEQAFAMWSSSEGMASWWAKHSRIELRPGGFYELYFMMDSPPGKRGGEGCRVLSFLPGRMISFTWNAPPHLPETRRCPTWVVLEFEEVKEGTRVRLTHTGWPAEGWDERPWQETYDYFDAAWGRVFQNLVGHFDVGPG